MTEKFTTKSRKKSEKPRGTVAGGLLLAAATLGLGATQFTGERPTIGEAYEVVVLEKAAEAQARMASYKDELADLIYDIETAYPQAGIQETDQEGGHIKAVTVISKDSQRALRVVSRSNDFGQVDIVGVTVSQPETDGAHMIYYYQATDSSFNMHTMRYVEGQKVAEEADRYMIENVNLHYDLGGLVPRQTESGEEKLELEFDRFVSEQATIENLEKRLNPIRGSLNEHLASFDLSIG